MIGETILHYKILEKLGEDGMGEVYKAQDTKLDRFVISRSAVQVRSPALRNLENELFSRFFILVNFHNPADYVSTM